MTYVITEQGKPIMPCENVVARLLLKDGKAKCIRRTPFTIKLLQSTTEYTQSMTHGIDTGSAKIGSAVVDDNGQVLYLSEIEIRNDITEKMTRRAKYRRNRRNRKTRYRPARWQNRKNSIRKDRFSPTMVSKIESHLKEVRFVASILPITNSILETATFDPHALKNPAVLENKWLYQRGANYGYANSRAYALARDKYECQICKGRTKSTRLEVHHIVYRTNGGSDDSENLITLCDVCHEKLHSGKVEIKGGKRKSELKYAAQMNSIRVQLLRRLRCTETFGYITKEHRNLMGLPKQHCMDAVAIASLHNIEKDGCVDVSFKTNEILYKKCVSTGDYQQNKGIRSEQRIPTGKVHGFRKFDKVRYMGNEYFIKGRMSSGYAILMNIEGKAQKLKPIPKFSKMKRIGARKSWVVKAIHLTA